MPLKDTIPSVETDAWVAPSASLIGKVDVSSKASVWYGAVVRGEWKRSQRVKTKSGNKEVYTHFSAYILEEMLFGDKM